MAAVDFFSAFGYKWGQTGNTITFQDDQYKVGWSFIGDVPPSVEQFNELQQLTDEKANWLFAQLQTAATELGVTLGAGNLGGLLQVIQAITPDASVTVKGLIEIASTSEAQAMADDVRALTPKKLAEALAGPAGQTAISGRLLGVQTFTASTTYTPTPGTKSIVVECQGGGGGGGASLATSAGAISCGSGGGAGTYGKAWFQSGFSGAAVTVGVGGSGGNSSFVAQPGGTSSFGSLLSCPGGSIGGFGVVTTPPTLPPASGAGGVSAAASGANIYSSRGAAGTSGLAFSASSGQGGQGASSLFGASPNPPYLSVPTNGQSAVGYGAGGNGATSAGAGNPAHEGGNGSPGLVTVWEYA